MPLLLLSVGFAEVVVLPLLAVTMMMRSPTDGVAVTVCVPLVVFQVTEPKRADAATRPYFLSQRKGAKPAPVYVSAPAVPGSVVALAK